MDHERAWLAEKYAARINDTLVDGPIAESGGWPSMIYALKCSAARIVEVCTLDAADD